MNPRKHTYKVAVIVWLFFTFCQVGKAQCMFDLKVEEVQNAYCRNNGTISISMTGANLNSVYIELLNSSGTVVSSSTSANQQFTALNPGAYTVRAYNCRGASNQVMKEATVTVEDERESLEVFRTENFYRQNSMRCLPTGVVFINIVKGTPRPFYTIEIKSAPDEYLGEKVFKIDSAGIFNVEKLPKGTYSFDVSDGCEKASIPNVAINNITRDLPVLPYGTSITTGSNCEEAFACVNKTLYADLKYYWDDNRSEYYEVAFSFDGSEPAADAWMSPDDCSKLYLPDIYKEMYDNDMKVKAYLRIKGAEDPGCMIVEELSFAPPVNELRFEDYDLNCEDYAYTFDVNTSLCPPFRWELSHVGTVVQSGDGIENLRIENLTYDEEYFLKLFDGDGNIIEIDSSQTIRVFSPLPEIDPPTVWLSCKETIDAQITLNSLICLPVTWEVFSSGSLVQSSSAPVYTNSFRIYGLEYDVVYDYIITDSLGRRRVLDGYFYERKDTVNITATQECTYYDMLFRHQMYCPFDLEMKQKSNDSIVGSAKDVRDITVRDLQYDTIYTILVIDSRTGIVLMELDTMVQAQFGRYQTMEVDEYKCEEYTLSILNSAKCDELKWNVTIRHEADGSLVFSGEYEDMPGLQYDVGYIVTITDEIGRDTSVIFNKSINDMLATLTFTGRAEYLSCLRTTDLIDGHISITGSLYPGTRIRFLSGPKTPVHLDVVIDTTTSVFYPFSQDYLIKEDVAMEKGNYAFEVIDRCGILTDTIYVYFESQKYEIRDLGYDLDEVTELCNGTSAITRLYPRGQIYRNGVLLPPEERTWFTVIESPKSSNGNNINGSTVAPSGFFRMSETGRYVFQIRTDECSFDTLGVHFERKPVDTDGISSYMCGNGTDMGYIFMQAKGGLPPYAYILEKTGEKNTTGLFQVNTSIGETYKIFVEDACEREAPFYVQIIALEQMPVTGGKPDVCKGDDLNLTSMLMGATKYEWKKPDGTVILTQNLHVPNVTFDDAGDYTVLIVPFGCSEAIERTITVTVNEPPPPVVDDTIFVCKAGRAYPLRADAIAGHKIQWYDENLQLVDSVTVSGDEERVFYVSQICLDLGCVSEKKKVIIKKDTKQVVFLSADIKNLCTHGEENTGAINLVVSGGSTPYTYLWSPGATTQDSLVNIPAGDYTVEVEDAYGCSALGSYTVKNQSLIALTLKMEQSYDCASAIGTQTTILTNISGGTTPYKQPEWIIDGVTAALGYTLITSPDNETVTLRVTDDRRCVQDTTFTTSIPDYGVYTSVIDCNDRIYGFDAVVYDASGNTYLWEFGDGQTSTDRSPQMQFEQPGEYEATLTISNSFDGSSCTYRQPFEVYPIPDVIAEDVRFCVGDSAIAIVTGSADYYIWRHGNKADTTDVYIIKKIGGYTIKGVTENGCWKSTSIEASYYPYYQYQIYTDRREVTPDNPAIQVRTDEIAGSFLTWDFGDGYIIDDRNDLTHIYDVSHDTKYRLELSAINPHGCLETAFTFIHVNMIPLANTFSPNGDGIHDVFLRGWRIEVFNRNGVLLYEGTEGWDGTYKGVPVGSDTYFYCLYDQTEEGVKRYVNYVTVVR